MTDPEIIARPSSGKICTQCGEWKIHADFVVDKRTKDGLHAWCRLCKRAADRRYHQANKERISSQRKTKYWQNPELHRERSRRWNRENPEKLHERQRQWSKNNKEYAKEKSREWKRQNKDRVRIHNKNRLHRQRSAEGSYGPDDVENIYKQQKGKCAYCQRQLRRKFHIDHILALIKGGTNWPRNIQLLCASCNLAKHQKDPITYAQELGKLL